MAALVEAELDRRYPERAQFAADHAGGFQEAWNLIERQWEVTFERPGRLPPEMLHESVSGERSFVQMMRHLALAKSGRP